MWLGWDRHVHKFAREVSMRIFERECLLLQETPNYLFEPMQETPNYLFEPMFWSDAHVLEEEWPAIPSDDDPEEVSDWENAWIDLRGEG